MAAVFPSPESDPSDLSLDLDAFAATLSGTLIRPDSPDYDQTRRINSTLADRHPVVIVRAADAADVARTVVFAAETGLELAVRAGGHSVPGIARKHSLSLPIIQAVLAEDADEKPVVVSPYLIEEEETVSV